MSQSNYNYVASWTT